MARRKKFQVFGHAVKHVLETTTVGYQSSIVTLVKEAKKHYNGHIRPETSIISAAYVARSQWKKEKGIVNDARTHDGIPERNMRSTYKMESDKCNQAIAIAQACNIETIEAFINLFNHKSQMKVFCEYFRQKAAADQMRDELVSIG